MGDEFYLAVILAGAFASSTLPFLLYYKTSPKPFVLMSLAGLLFLFPGALVLAMLEGGSFVDALTLNVDSRSSATNSVVMPYFLSISGLIIVSITGIVKFARKKAASNKSLNSDAGDAGAG